MNSENRQLTPLAFLWPALAAGSASEFASAMAREFANLAVGVDSRARSTPPRWTTRNRVALELPAVRLRDFSRSRDGPATLVCAPFALHGATIVDFATDHSLIAALQIAGVNRLFVTDWRSAGPDMRFWSIDDYLCTLNLLIDELGGCVDLVGLCQGGWMSLIYAARFPGKVRKLVLAGAPIDMAAGHSKLSELAGNTPNPLFKEFVALGEGRVLGRWLLQWWSPHLDTADIHALLQSLDEIGSAPFRRLEARFRHWYGWTVDLPGTYYLQVVDQLFKENRLASGNFAALGRRIALSKLRCPLYLLAGRDDDVAAPAQLFATEHLVDSGRCRVDKAALPCGHLSLFMGKESLGTAWPAIARWLQA
jgi:poly(3-hydroxybutyrate) depolymerase